MLIVIGFHLSPAPLEPSKIAEKIITLPEFLKGKIRQNNQAVLGQY
jgi:hypothetical protein